MAGNGIKYTDRTADHRTAQQIIDRVRALESGPKRQEYLRLLKEQFPDLTIPEIDAAKPVLNEVAELRKMFSDHVEGLKKEREERETKERESAAEKTVTQGRSWLRSKQKLDDEGVAAVEKLMTDRSVADYEAGYLLWQKDRPPAPVDLPNTTLGNSLDWFKAEENRPDKDLLLKDPLLYRKQRSGQILHDLRAGLIDEFGRPTNRAA